MVAPTSSPPGGQAGVAQALVQLRAGERALRRGLEDHRVAGHQRAAGGPRGQRHREVERADHRPDPVGPQHAAGVLVRGELPHLVGEAVVALHLVAVVADQVGRLLHVAERLEAVLADLHGHQGGQLVGAVADQVRRAAQQGDAVPPRRARPGREGGPGRRDGVVDVALAGLVEAAEHKAGVVGAGEGEDGAVVARLAVDVDREGGPQPGPRGAHALLVGGVQLLVVGRQGGVGDAELGLGHWVPSGGMRGSTTRVTLAVSVPGAQAGPAGPAAVSSASSSGPWARRPATRVATASVQRSRAGSPASTSPGKTARSARWPAWMRPVMRSCLASTRPPRVNSSSATARPSPCGERLWCTAAATPFHGSSGVTSESDPPAMGTPRRHRSANGFMLLARLAPRRRRYMPPGPPQAASKAGCTLTVRPSSAMRSAPSEPSSSACSMRWRQAAKAVRPTVRTARLAQRSAWPMARSPMAWTASWMPARVARTYSSVSSASPR